MERTGHLEGTLGAAGRRPRLAGAKGCSGAAVGWANAIALHSQIAIAAGPRPMCTFFLTRAKIPRLRPRAQTGTSGDRDLVSRPAAPRVSRLPRAALSLE